MEDVKTRLEYLRQQLRDENISYGEIAELQNLQDHIEDDDVELLEAAGVPEGYRRVDRESLIDDLIRWIAETKSANDKELMMEDLKILMDWDCKYVYSSQDTNDYIKIED